MPPTPPPSRACAALCQFNPTKRITAAEALAHPYVAQFHVPEDEPSCSRVITIPINDNCKYSISDYRWAGGAGGHVANAIDPVRGMGCGARRPRAAVAGYLQPIAQACASPRRVGGSER
jgi:hypothetical protein